MIAGWAKHRRARREAARSRRLPGRLDRPDRLVGSPRRSSPPASPRPAPNRSRSTPGSRRTNAGPGAADAVVLGNRRTRCSPPAAGCAPTPRSAAPRRSTRRSTIGSGFSLRTRLPTATFDDMTVARRSPSPTASTRRSAGARLAAGARASCATTAAPTPAAWPASGPRPRSGRTTGSTPTKIHVVGLGRNSPARALERDWTRRASSSSEPIGSASRARPSSTPSPWSARAIPRRALDLIGGHPPVDAPGVEGHGFLSLDSAEGRRPACGNPRSRHLPCASLQIRALRHRLPSTPRRPGYPVSVRPAAAPRTRSATAASSSNPPTLQELSQAMLEMCDPVTARTFGERAFAHSAGFSWRQVGERILSALPLD